MLFKGGSWRKKTISTEEEKFNWQEIQIENEMMARYVHAGDELLPLEMYLSILLISSKNQLDFCYGVHLSLKDSC